MKTLTVLLTVAMVLLSVAAGAAKIAQVPDEVQFLNGFGFSQPGVFLYGVVQIIGGL